MLSPLMNRARKILLLLTFQKSNKTLPHHKIELWEHFRVHLFDQKSLWDLIHQMDLFAS